MTPGGIHVVEARGAMLLFDGCHSNQQATSALPEEARRLGISPERTICTGDIVAYSADLEATLDVARHAGIHVVMGNYEEALCERAEGCGCGFTPGSACDRFSAAPVRRLFTAGILDPSLTSRQRDMGKVEAGPMAYPVSAQSMAVSLFQRRLYGRG